MDFPLCEDLDARVAVLGILYGDAYTIEEVTNAQANAPTAIQVESKNILIGLDHYDFDIGGALFDGKAIKVVDAGDIIGDARDLGAHYPRA
jgi:agmatinase